MRNRKTIFFAFWGLLLVTTSCCHALKGVTYDNVPELLKGMASKNPNVYRKAYKDAQMLEKSDIPALFKELENENPTICAIAINMLVGTINDKEETTTALKNLLKSERKVVRQSAALRLTTIEPSLRKELMPILVEAVKETPEYEIIAASLLGDIGPEAKDAVPAIIESMKRHPETLYTYLAALRFIGTPEALEAIKPYEQEKARRKKLIRPVSMLADNRIGSFLITTAFLGLFLWSRARRKKGDRLICWPLLFPVFFWGIFALFPLMRDPFFYGLYGFGTCIGLVIITLTALIPWLASLLWRKKHTAPSTPTS
ncbi:MAG: hypothetical protein KKH28_11850 [Elusimicrobia bacterium]|nr:hypothetical protein [Elusimicrobiota bacterium]